MTKKRTKPAKMMKELVRFQKILNIYDKNDEDLGRPAGEVENGLLSPLFVSIFVDASLLSAGFVLLLLLLLLLLLPLLSEDFLYTYGSALLGLTSVFAFAFVFDFETIDADAGLAPLAALLADNIDRDIVKINARVIKRMIFFVVIFHYVLEFSGMFYCNIFVFFIYYLTTKML